MPTFTLLFFLSLAMNVHQDHRKVEPEFCQSKSFYDLQAFALVILDNWDCIASIEVKYRRHSKKCVKDFVKSVKKRPANVCP